MTKSELKKFKETLEAKQAELEQFVRNREGIAIEKSPDALDEVQHAAERELAIRNLDRESQLLRNVRAAAPHRRRHVWRVPALRGGYQSQARGSRAVDALLHSVPGDCRSQSERRRIGKPGGIAGSCSLISVERLSILPNCAGAGLTKV